MKKKGLFSLLVKIFVSAVVLGIAAWLTPGFSISGGFGTLLITAVVVGLLSWGVVESRV